MKEPFIALAGITALVTSSGAIHDPALAGRVGAVLAAGACSALYSWWKSRKRKADSTDTAIWALIALFGSMSFGWFLGPELAGREIMGVPLPAAPLMTWLLTLSGVPVIEWMLDGRALRLVMKKLGIEMDDGCDDSTR